MQVESQRAKQAQKDIAHLRQQMTGRSRAVTEDMMQMFENNRKQMAEIQTRHAENLAQRLEEQSLVMEEKRELGKVAMEVYGKAFRDMREKGHAVNERMKTLKEQRETRINQMRQERDKVIKNLCS